MTEHGMSSLKQSYLAALDCHDVAATPHDPKKPHDIGSDTFPLPSLARQFYRRAHTHADVRKPPVGNIPRRRSQLLQHGQVEDVRDLDVL